MYYLWATQHPLLSGTHPINREQLWIWIKDGYLRRGTYMNSCKKKKKGKKTRPLYSYLASSHNQQPQYKIPRFLFFFLLFFLDYTPFISRSSISRLRPKCCWSNKDNYAANLHKTTALCVDLILPFLGGGGRANYTSNRQGGIKKRKRRGEYCKCGISPSPRASQHNATLDKWAKSQTNLKRDSFHSAAAEEREAGRRRRGERGEGRGVSFFILWLIPTATGGKLMSAFQIYDALPCTLNVDFVPAETLWKANRTAHQKVWGEKKMVQRDHSQHASPLFSHHN